MNKRRYPLLKDSEGIFQATPLGQKMDGGTFIPNWSESILMSLTFQAPPDDVTSVDLMLPDFLPIEGVAIAGLGGAATGRIAANQEGLDGSLEAFFEFRESDVRRQRTVLLLSESSSGVKVARALGHAGMVSEFASIRFTGLKDVQIESSPIGQPAKNEP